MIFHHIGVFVRDLQQGQRDLGLTVPIKRWGEIFVDDTLNVEVCFGVDAAGLRYELVAPHGSPNPVSRVLETKRNILNHTAYVVPDIAEASKRLRSTGALPIGSAKPAVAFDGAPVAFFLTSLGFVLELIEQAASRA